MASELAAQSLANTGNYPYAGANLANVDLSAGYGCCDMDRDLREQFWSLNASRNSTGFITFTSSGAGASLICANGSAVNVFDAGPGEAGATQGFPAGENLSLSETDGGRQGQLTESNMLFIGVGFSLSILRPWVYDAAGHGKQYTPWLDEYQSRIIEALMEGASYELSFGQSACKYEFGALSQLPASTGRFGGGVANGQSVTGLFTWARAPFVSMSNNDSRKMTGRIAIGGVTSGTGGLRLEITNNAAVPVPAALSVLVGVRVQVWGFNICRPTVCPPGGGDVVAQLAALQAQIARMQGR